MDQRNKIKDSLLEKETQFVFTVGENLFRCHTLERNMLKSILFFTVGVLTAFIPLLIAFWYPAFRILLTYDACHPTQATAVLIEDKDGSRTVAQVLVVSLPKRPANETSKDQVMQPNNIYFCYKFLRYFWIEQHQQFVELGDMVTDLDLRQTVQGYSHVSEDDRSAKLLQYGDNLILVPMKSALRIFLDLAVDPFYVFQLFSCILWIVHEYLSLSIFVLVISFITLVSSTYSTRKQLLTIKNMVTDSQTVEVAVTKDSSRILDAPLQKMNSERLVPGDIIAIRGNYHMFCDAILLSGSCIVDEASLTGEAVPINKQGIDNWGDHLSSIDRSEKLWTDSSLRRHALFNGTRVMKATSDQASNIAFAIVISTGFYSLKGRLLRSIIRPTPLALKFFRDSLKFLSLVAAIASLGFAYTVYALHKEGVSPGVILINALDVITIAVSPMLPIALNTGILLAAKHLKQQAIFCTDLSRVTPCGKIKLVCFDKTGTLTEDRLQVKFVHGCENGVFGRKSDSIETVPDRQLTWALASCHSLCLIDNEVLGDPLEIPILRFTNYSLAPDEHIAHFRQTMPWPITAVLQDRTNTTKITVIKRFHFEFELKRMSVLIHDSSSDELYVYTKGSPEAVANLCLPNSLPSSFTEHLDDYTKSGYRVIAYACKSIGKAHLYDAEAFGRLSRSYFECDLALCGLVVLENKLKAVTASTMTHLHNAALKTMMLTGDHLNTAVHVAMECGLLLPGCEILKLSRTENDNCLIEIVPQYADSSARQPDVKLSVTNDSVIASSSCKAKSEVGSEELRRLMFTLQDEVIVMTSDDADWLRLQYPSIYSKVLVHGKVFARASPDQKAQLVRDLRSLGYTACMCGDGANDCSALKEADAGISLSESEASIAAPFTSLVQDISCIPILIREGRAALVTSFSCFKFIALYSLIQFVTVLILFSVGSNLSDYQFLFIDAVLGLGLVTFIVEARPNPRLSTKRPLGRLFHPTVLVSVFGQLGIQTAFQLACFFYVRLIPWYLPPKTVNTADYKLDVQCFENTVLFSISCFQYLTVAMAYAEGPPFRQRSLLNTRFFSFVLTLAVMTVVIAVHPGRLVQDLLLLVPIPDYTFSLSLIVIALGNGFVSMVFETYVMQSGAMKVLLRKLRRKKSPRNAYKDLLRTSL